jgi:tRNA A-37 threonylcarbamoyl transferase component Bud32
MSDTKNCPSCRAPLPPDATRGVCPACLLEAGLAGGGPAPADDGVPPIEELAPKFPALEIESLIGRGGMGVVYRARHKALDRAVALKVLAAHVASDRAFADRFQREARALAKLQHPNIVAVHDFGLTDGLFWLVMEFVDGVNVREAMAAGQIGPDAALRIVPQVCDALQYAHEHGVVHRDIKPENILLDRTGRVKVADFGLAKLTDRAAADVSLTGVGQVMGTLHYMAPEQWERPKDVDHRADIYSLGVVFYEMLTGELPVGRFAAPSTKSAVDARIDEIVLRTLARERDARYQQVAEVKTDVGLVTAPAPAAAPVTAPAPAAAEVTPVAQAAAGPSLRRQLWVGAVLAACGAVWWAVKDREVVWTVLPLAGLAVMAIAVWYRLRQSATVKPSRRNVEFGAGMLLVAAGLMAKSQWNDERDQLALLAVAVGWLMVAFGAPAQLAATPWSPSQRKSSNVLFAIVAAVFALWSGGALLRNSEFPRPESQVAHSPAADAVTLRSPLKIGTAQEMDLEEITQAWEHLRATHASLEVERALRFYVPEVADHLRTRLSHVDVHDGSCGIPLANAKALRGSISALLLRSVDLDESGHFATAEASDGVRCVTFRMTRYRVRASIGGDDKADRGAFRWAFLADPIQVQ